MSHRIWQIFCMLLCVASTLVAQETVRQGTTTCNFDSSKQLALRYQRITFDNNKHVLGRQIPYGKVWAPGGKPMTLFVNSPVTVGTKDLPVGAYTLFLIPSEKTWTLVVSKSTDTSGRYEPSDDLARVPMEDAQLGSPQDQFDVVFGHVAPTLCNLRVYMAKSAAWVGFHEK